MASGQTRKNSNTDPGSSSSVQNDNCGICGCNVENEHKGTECEICKHWFHANCIDIEDNEYEVMTSHKRELFTGIVIIVTLNQSNCSGLYLISKKGCNKLIKNDTKAKFNKMESDYEAMKYDLRTLNQKNR